MASNSDSSIGTVLGIGAVLFIVYLIWPKSAAASQQQQLQNGQQNSALASLLKALTGNKSGASAGSGGGAPSLPMGGVGNASPLSQFLGAVNNIGLTPSDWFQGDSSNDTGALDNYQLPEEQTQLLDLSNLNQPLTTDSSSLSDPIIDPSSGLDFSAFDSGSDFDTGDYTSFDGGGYSFG